MTIRLAMIGAGRIASVNPGAIAENRDAVLVAVSDAIPAAKAGFTTQWGCEVQSLDAIAADA